MKMDINEAKRILSLVANDPDHGEHGAWEDQDKAARVVLRELRRLETENKLLLKQLSQKSKEEST